MSDKNIDKEKELLEQLEEFKKEILLNREASMGVSNYIWMGDEEVFYLIEIIEKQYKELEIKDKMIDKMCLDISNELGIKEENIKTRYRNEVLKSE